MQRKMYTLLIATFTIGLIFTGCGNSKDKDKEANGTEVGKIEETEIIEVMEDATMTESEDGSIIVETDTGEQVVIDDSTKVTENEDGSKTYETEDGTKVNVNADGQTTVTKEEKVPVDTQTPPANNTEEAHSHSYTASVTKEASCTEKGVKTYTCSCGSSYTKDMDAKGHASGDWVTVKEANCKEEGSKQKSCTTCGTVLETEAISKTSTHTPSDWIVTKEATCSTNGSKHKVCSVCGVETETATITANGTHNYSWSTNGDTRTMKCACGATGITEYKYGNVWGYFDDAAAEELWGLINNLRNNTWYGFRDPMGNHISSYVSSLNKNNDLFTKAKRRAAEVALDYSHNGEQHECLAAGVPTAHEAKDDWVNSDTHCKALTDPDYTIGGVACFWYDSAGDGNCYPIWVFELGY